MIWRENKWLLGALALLLLLNAIFFVTYRVRYENRLQALDEDLAAAQVTLRGHLDREEEAERMIASIERSRNDLQQVYEVWWSTQPERLAPLIVELQTLARKSGLNPPSRNYDYQEQRDRATSTVGARVMTVTFTVEGRYDQIRTLINLIELSPHFVIIEELALSDSSARGEVLRMNLRLKTLFQAEAEEGRPRA
jgi:hypothetical protein